jgi:hypothetical protein
LLLPILGAFSTKTLGHMNSVNFLISLSHLAVLLPDYAYKVRTELVSRRRRFKELDIRHSIQVVLVGIDLCGFSIANYGSSV